MVPESTGLLAGCGIYHNPATSKKRRRALHCVTVVNAPSWSASDETACAEPEERTSKDHGHVSQDEVTQARGLTNNLQNSSAYITVLTQAQQKQTDDNTNNFAACHLFELNRKIISALDLSLSATA